MYIIDFHQERGTYINIADDTAAILLAVRPETGMCVYTSKAMWERTAREMAKLHPTERAAMMDATFKVSSLPLSLVGSLLIAIFVPLPQTERTGAVLSTIGTTGVKSKGSVRNPMWRALLMGQKGGMLWQRQLEDKLGAGQSGASTWYPTLAFCPLIFVVSKTRGVETGG